MAKNVLTAEQKRMKKRLFRSNLRKSWPLYLFVILPVAWYILFCYVPMFGNIIAFKDYNAYLGIFDSPWLEDPFEHFKAFLTNKELFWGLVFKNTVIVGTVTTLFTFTVPIVLAILFNEIRLERYRKTLQTVSYMPYFVSAVAIVNIALMMLNKTDGVINNVLASFGVDRIDFINQPQWFLLIYILLNLWKGAGWSTIIYTAAMTGIDTQLYEAADIEGAGRFAKIWHITLPCIRPTLVIMMILALPGVLSGDLETIMLLQTPGNTSVSYTMPLHIYDKGIYGSHEYSYTTAVGLFMSLLNLILIVGANKVAKKVSDTSLF